MSLDHIVHEGWQKLKPKDRKKLAPIIEKSFRQQVASVGGKLNLKHFDMEIFYNGRTNTQQFSTDAEKNLYAYGEVERVYGGIKPLAEQIAEYITK